MTKGRRRLPILVIAGLLGSMALTGDSGSPRAQGQAAAYQETRDRLFARGDIQFELPGWDGAPGEASETVGGDWRIEERDLAEPRDLRLDLDLDLPPFWSFLLWTIAVCGGLLLLYWLVDSLSGFAWPGGGKRREAARAEEILRAARRPEQVLDAAERLAAEGRFEEAVHTLLLDGLGILRRRLGGRVAEALTSREIVALSDVPQAGQSALRGLVARVELTYFGERPASAEDYRTCRGLFEDFVQAMRAAQ